MVALEFCYNFFDIAEILCLKLGFRYVFFDELAVVRVNCLAEISAQIQQILLSMLLEILRFILIRHVPAKRALERVEHRFLQTPENLDSRSVFLAFGEVESAVIEGEVFALF